MDEAVDVVTTRLDGGGGEPAPPHQPPFQWLKQPQPGHSGGAASNLQPPPAMDKNAQAAAWWNSLTPAEQRQIQSKQTTQG